MPLRPATYSDILPSSQILATAFKDEYLFSTFMHPNLPQYPSDLYLHFLHHIRVAYVSGPDNHLLVSYNIDSTTKEETITGFAHWRRVRPVPRTSYVTDLSKKAVQTYNYLESFVYPNRAADPARAGALRECWPFMQHHWTGSRAEVWDLVMIGVDPQFHGQGIGRDLVQWGFERAREDGVGCSVISAEGKERFYQRQGFDVVAGRAGEEGGNENPLRGVPGGTILFWDNGRSLEDVKGFGEA